MNPGDVYGRLTVVALLPGFKNRNGRHPSGARVRCVCGGETIVHRRNLVTGHTGSCGCLQRERAAGAGRATRTHGHAVEETPEYSTWQAMKKRVTNPRATGWQYYGGRGIGLCERWLRFENFLADMGTRPAGTTLDRIDPDRGYEPGNCRWADHHTQALNRRPRARAEVKTKKAS